MQTITFFEDRGQVETGFTLTGFTAPQIRGELAEKGLMVARPQQVHKDSIGIVTEELCRQAKAAGETEIVFPDTDGVISSCEGVVLTTVHADCLPVLLYDEASGAMGAVHAGWRGTCAGIAAKAVREMVKHLNASVDTMRAAIGPGIAFCCFETGPEVYEAFRERYSFTDEYARRQENGKYFLDLKAINERQLRDLGISQIEISPLCTYCSQRESGEPLFYSYRREQGTDGRMVSYIYRR